MTRSQKIFLGLFLGIVAGILINKFDPQIAPAIKVFSQIFLRLIKMIIAPLIFTTLVAGIAGAGHFKDVGRMGLRAIIYFEVVTTIALVLGLVLVNMLKPGVGVVLPQTATQAAQAPQSWDQILLHVIPESVIDAMAKGDVLQIVVFSMIFAIGLGMVTRRPDEHQRPRSGGAIQGAIHAHADRSGGQASDLLAVGRRKRVFIDHRRLAARGDDRIHVGNVPGPLPLRGKIGHQLLARQTLRFRQ